MFRTIKVLNNNGVLALSTDNNKEVIILGKGIGFGKKVNQRFETGVSDKVYELQKETEKGDSHSRALSIEPVYLEITSAILQKAKEDIGEIDSSILLALADHIAFAVKRINELGYIHNPMNSDIKALFKEEYKVAKYGGKIIKDTIGIDFDENELSYIALHIHSAVDNSKISDIMGRTQIIHKSVDTIEKRMNTSIDKDSLSYNRLMTHIKYMLVRMENSEGTELDMNPYIQHQYPDTFKLALEICNDISNEIHLPYNKEEIGYLAIHIERVCLKNTKI